MTVDPATSGGGALGSAPTTTLPDLPPTQRWLAHLPPAIPPLEGAEGFAERLLLLVHYSVDWENGWVARPQHRARYWEEILPSRVNAATFRGTTLRHWWQDLKGRLDLSPRRRTEREELQQLLTLPAAEQERVLDALREQTDVLVMRTRITADKVRQARPAPNPS